MRGARAQECFGGGLEDGDRVPDFDFEANHALFDKKKVFAEFAAEDGTSDASYNLSGTTELLVDQNKVKKAQKVLPGGHLKDKMHFTEMVLDHARVDLPASHQDARLRTENLVATPQISEAAMAGIHRALADIGLTRAHTIETSGCCAAQMILSLLGGSGRINPQNKQQAPEVIVLLGTGSKRAEAICIARHLANHHVRVMLYLTPEVEAAFQVDCFAQYKLFQHTSGRVIKSPRELPKDPLDLVIDAIGPDAAAAVSSNLPSCCTAAITWCANVQAPVVSLEVPGGVDAQTGPHARPFIKPTRCLAFGLPKVRRRGLACAPLWPNTCHALRRMADHVVAYYIV